MPGSFVPGVTLIWNFRRKVGDDEKVGLMPTAINIYRLESSNFGLKRPGLRERALV
jgi:hypothetical protein